MTEIEKKALALVNEVTGLVLAPPFNRDHPYGEALCRAIEQHEAFRQEVSDAITEYCGGPKYVPSEPLARFIIAKPDPLVEVLDECGFGVSSNAADDIRAALAARGLKIVEDK